MPVKLDPHRLTSFYLAHIFDDRLTRSRISHVRHPINSIPHREIRLTSRASVLDLRSTRSRIGRPFKVRVRAVHLKGRSDRLRISHWLASSILSTVGQFYFSFP